MAAINRFFGLNNTTEPLSLEPGWLTSAVNVDVTDAGKIVAREGYIQSRVGSFTGGFATADRKRGYVATVDGIETIQGKVVSVSPHEGETLWAEMNGQVYFVRGPHTGIIRSDDEVIQWRWSVPTVQVVDTGSAASATEVEVGVGRRLSDGRSTGVVYSVPTVVHGGFTVTGCASGTEIYIRRGPVFALVGITDDTFAWNMADDVGLGDAVFHLMSPIPNDPRCICAHGGRVYSGHHFPHLDASYIWKSQPLAPHVFDLSKDFFAVPGKIQMIASHAQSLVVGTDRAIFALDENGLKVLTEYGVPAGQHAVKDGERLLFWSDRGVCAVFPFVNLTERQVSVPPGLRAGGALVMRGGQKRLVISLKSGGAAFNPL